MKKSLHHFILSFFILVTACFLTYLITFSETDKFWNSKITDMLATDTSEMSKGLGELANAVGERHIYEVDSTDASDGVKNGYVSALGDKYSMYMDLEEYNNYLRFTDEFSDVGIGISTIYNSELDGICIMNVYKGSPAEKSRIVPGDMILAIDSVDVAELGYYGAMCKLGLGEEGDEILVRVRKIDGKYEDIYLQKSAVKAQAVTSANLKNRIGLIRIESFEKDSMKDFKSAMESLLKSGCEKFVIDVRNNPGGNIEEISSILDFLIGEGNLFTIYQKNGAADTRVSKNKSVPYPMAILVNERTACGAEVFAGVLANFDMAELVGTRTCGKATIQTLTELSDGSAVSLSTAKYIFGTSVDFDKVGLTPDISSELSTEAVMKYTSLSRNDDTQLQSAIEYLKEKQVIYAKD